MLNKNYNELKECGDIEDSNSTNLLEIFRDIWIVESFKDDIPLYSNNIADAFLERINGIEVIIFRALGAYSCIEVFKVLYFDGEELRIFTPFEGNAVNIITKTVLGYEYLHKNELNYKAKALMNKIYGENIKIDILNRSEFIERYIKYFNPNESYNEFSAIRKNKKAVIKEITREINRLTYFK